MGCNWCWTERIALNICEVVFVGATQENETNNYTPGELTGGGGGDYTTNCTQLVWYVFMPYSKEVHCSIPGDWWWFSCVCCSTCGREFDFQIITTTFHHERWDHRKKELDCICPPSITNLLDTFSSAMCWRETLMLADQTTVSQGRIQTHDSSTTSPLITTFTVTLSPEVKAKK